MSTSNQKFSLGDVKQYYENLLNAAAKRRRGYDFEILLKKLFTLNDLEPRSGCKPIGQKIDGSVYLDGRFYLLEAKWHADPLPASTLYQFKGKVDGELAGTLGISISMPGYADDAVDGLTLGKGLNVSSVDRGDMDAAIFRGHGVKKVLKLKLRKAAEEGAIYFPVEGQLVTGEKKLALSKSTTCATITLPALSSLLGWSNKRMLICLSFARGIQTE